MNRRLLYFERRLVVKNKWGMCRGVRSKVLTISESKGEWNWFKSMMVTMTKRWLMRKKRVGAKREGRGRRGGEGGEENERTDLLTSNCSS